LVSFERNYYSSNKSGKLIQILTFLASNVQQIDSCVSSGNSPSQTTTTTGFFSEISFLKI